MPVKLNQSLLEVTRVRPDGSIVWKVDRMQRVLAGDSVTGYACLVDRDPGNACVARRWNVES